MYWIRKPNNDGLQQTERASKESQKLIHQRIVHRATTRRIEQQKLSENQTTLKNKIAILSSWVNEAHRSPSRPTPLPDLVTTSKLENYAEANRVVVLLGHEGKSSIYPSKRHLNLDALVHSKLVNYIICTSTDGHQRAVGTPSDKMIELMGNSKEEICSKCGMVWYRDYSVGPMSADPLSVFGYYDLNAVPQAQRRLLSGSRCDKLDCRSPLLYRFVAEDDMVSKSKFVRAMEIASRASILIVLGTRLASLPEAILPAVFCVDDAAANCSVGQNSKLVIVHDQSTSLDHKAHLKVNSSIDEVLTMLLEVNHINRPLRFKLIRYFKVWSEFNPTARKPYWTLMVKSYDGRKEPISALHIIEAYSESYGELVATADSCSSFMKLRMFCTNLRPGEIFFRIFFSGTYNEPCLQLEHVLSTSIEGKSCAKLWKVELSTDKTTGVTSWSKPKWVKDTQRKGGNQQIEHELAGWKEYAYSKELPTPMMQQPNYFTKVESTQFMTDEDDEEEVSPMEKLRKEMIHPDQLFNPNVSVQSTELSMSEISRRVERALFGVRFTNQALYRWATGQYATKSQADSFAHHEERKGSTTVVIDTNAKQTESTRGTASSTRIPNQRRNAVNRKTGMTPVKHQLFPSSTSHHLFDTVRKERNRNAIEEYERKLQSAERFQTEFGNPKLNFIYHKYNADRINRQQRLVQLASKVVNAKAASLLHDKPQWWKPSSETANV